MQTKFFFATILIFFVCFTTAFAQCVPPTNITFKAVSPTSSNGTTTNTDGKLILFGFVAGERFQVCESGIFESSNALEPIQSVDITGIIQNNIANPNITKTYTVRVYDATSDVCFIDYTATMYATWVAEIKTGETFTLKAPDTLTTVQWYEDGMAIVGATSSTFVATSTGRYTFSGTTPGGCTLPSCSPLELRSRGTLPVKLLFFNANVQVCDVILRWSTATELNAKSFDVYRSIDGINFTKIATLRAAGTTNVTQYYEYKDSAPFRTSYYKLVETDFDGTTETFNLAQRVLTANCDSNDANGISSLYPNPNGTDAVNVRFYSDREAETVDFLIYDMLGREVSSTPTAINNGATLVNLSIAELPSGTYSVKVRGNGWYSLAQKFVRVR